MLAPFLASMCLLLCLFCLAPPVFCCMPCAGKQMYESDAIITYLFNEYGDGQVPLGLRLGYATTISCGLALAPR